MKKQNNLPTVIDLFAGAGGMTEGLKKSGFKSVLANCQIPAGYKHA